MIESSGPCIIASPMSEGPGPPDKKNMGHAAEPSAFTWKHDHANPIRH